MLVPKRLQEIRPVHLSYLVIPVSFFYFLHPIFTPTLSNPCLVLLAVTFYLLQVFYSRPKTNLPPGSVSYLARWSLSFLLGPLHWSSPPSRPKRNVPQLCACCPQVRPASPSSATLPCWTLALPMRRWQASCQNMERCLVLKLSGNMYLTKHMCARCLLFT